MRLALADAFDLGGVQRIDLRPRWCWRCSRTRRASIKGMAEDLSSAPSPLILRTMSRDHPAQIGAQGPQRPIGALELFGLSACYRHSADGRSARVCRRARRIGVRSRHATSWRAGSVARGRDASAWRRSETPPPWLHRRVDDHLGEVGRLGRTGGVATYRLSWIRATSFSSPCAGASASSTNGRTQGRAERTPRRRIADNRGSRSNARTQPHRRGRACA